MTYRVSAEVVNLEIEDMLKDGNIDLGGINEQVKVWYGLMCHNK